LPVFQASHAKIFPKPRCLALRELSEIDLDLAGMPAGLSQWPGGARNLSVWLVVFRKPPAASNGTGEIDPKVAEYWREEFLNSATNPPAEAEVKYGLNCEHCWNGDPSLPNHISRLRFNTMYVAMILEHIKRSAPPDADLKSWQY
jgi:hypothetical protein